MKRTWQTLIPESLHAVVQTGLTGVFGAARIEVAEPILGGASGALAVHIIADNRAYLLRVETQRNALWNPHQYTCMRIAADAGLAPRVYHADDTAGIAIIDFIQQQPLEHYPGGPLRLSSALGTMLKHLQATSPFPSLIDYRDFVQQMLSNSQTLCVPGLLEPHGAELERIRAAYHWDPCTHVSSHNDPNPRNILFDGERLWLVDWETAYRNDPLLDVAILWENHAQSPALQDALLCSWYGGPPDPSIVARLRLMRLLSRLYYAGLLIALSGAPPTSITDLSAPSPEEFRAQIARGELAPTAPRTRIVLGKMYLAGFLAGTRCADFHDVLKLGG